MFDVGDKITNGDDYFTVIDRDLYSHPLPYYSVLDSNGCYQSGCFTNYKKYNTIFDVKKGDLIIKERWEEFANETDMFKTRYELSLYEFDSNIYLIKTANDEVIRYELLK